MVTEFGERPGGWPFGLGNLNQRLQDSQSESESESEQPVVPIQSQQQQITSHVPSSSFSSFSSSNSDTEKSSASFFKDHSVSLGRLMGMKPMEKKKKKKALYFSGTITFSRHCECEGIRERTRQDGGAEGEVMMMMGQRICVPLLVCILVKIGSTCKSKNE